MKSSKYISILCVGSLLSLASCTDVFESDNKINGSFDDTVFLSLNLEAKS